MQSIQTERNLKNPALQLPSPDYKEWFLTGTSPKGWTTDVPALPVLIAHLYSVGGVLNFFTFHEAMHLGTINVLKRAVSN